MGPGRAEAHKKNRKTSDSELSDHLIAPHGGTLVNLIVEDERALELAEASRAWPTARCGRFPSPWT